MKSIDFQDVDPKRRLFACEHCELTDVNLFLLRGAIEDDSDGRVRAAAAARVGSVAATMPALTLALQLAAEIDPMPMVRQAAWRSLGRALREDTDFAIVELARERIECEPTWWVRTAIAGVLAAGPAASRIDDLLGVLEDPFWRVRHVAIKALQRLGESEPSIRSAVVTSASRSDVEAAAKLFLQRAWTGERQDSLVPDLATTPPSDPLWDPDPAVITANLEAPGAKPSLELLVELLADAHESTRRAAMAHLRKRGQPREIRVALAWLDEQRIPYASRAAVALAHGLRQDTELLAADVFVDPPGPGALCWAISWAASVRADRFAADVARLLRHESTDVRTAAISAMVRFPKQAANDPTVANRIRTAAIQGTVASERVAAIEALSTLFPNRICELFTAESIDEGLRVLRALCLTAPNDDNGWTWLTSVAGSVVEPGARAIALRRLAGDERLDDRARSAALSDPDPWIRLAVLDERSASAHLEDPDPMVRQGAHKLALTVDGGVALRLSSSADPRDRAASVSHLELSSSAGLGRLVELWTDRNPGVRLSAAERLESVPNLAELLRHSTGARFRAALSWACRNFDATARDELEAAWARTDLGARSRTHIQTLRLALPDELACSVPPRTVDLEARSTPSANYSAVADAPRRLLGQTQIEVSPLVLSGVKGISVNALRHGFERGGNTFFWEPGYQHLSAFLRQPNVVSNSVVVAGTYHATAAEIEADVETALRRLKRDAIDLFLIFWVRSPNRLSAEVWDCLNRLKAAGKIRAMGFSTHHREIAMDEIDGPNRRSWDALMLRHSAAHVGAEAPLFTACKERDVGVLAFTSVCYGRLLAPSPFRSKTSAPDCYRYSLSQQGVTAVLSAPNSRRELEENVSVIRETALDAESIASMREHGGWVYAQSRDFGALIRRTPREIPRSTQAFQSIIGTTKSVENTLAKPGGGT